MASAGASSAAKSEQRGKINHEQIVAGFQDLRNQQRAIASKISELEMERKEHDLVIDALKEVEPSRTCFRMVGGVLVERTVNEVLPALQMNYDQLGKLVETLSTQLENKGKEINTYREKHGIRVRGEDDAAGDAEKHQDKAGAAGVLVAKDSS